MSIETLCEKIEAIVKEDKFLRDWLKGLEEEDIEERLLWGEDFEDLSKKERKELEKEKADDWLVERIDEFCRDLKTKAKWDGGLLMYRCIAVNNIEDFISKLKDKKFQKGYSGIGVFWAWDAEAADCHWGDGKHRITVVGRVPLSAINFYTTARANTDFHTHSEAEIQLKEGSQVEILGVRKNADAKELLETKIKVPARLIESKKEPEHQPFFDAVDKYTSPLPSHDFKGLKSLIEAIKKLPKPIKDRYSEYPYETYRGTYFTADQIQDLRKGKSLKIQPSSWSKDDYEALKFARGWNKPDIYPAVITYKPKKSEVILDLQSMVEDGFFEDASIDTERILDEAEIILDAVSITMQNIELVEIEDEDAFG
jgi:hypothetical protein